MGEALESLVVQRVLLKYKHVAIPIVGIVVRQGALCLTDVCVRIDMGPSLQAMRQSIRTTDIALISLA